MAADKRNFDNFENFPGKINEGTGFHEFPTLKKVDSMNRTRVWTIYIRLIKEDSPRLTGIDWNLLEEKQIPIKNEYYGHNETYTDLPKGTIAQVWVETGIESGKITRSAPTYFETGALQGQINERNPFHVALIYARGLYLKRKNTGSKKSDQKSEKTTVNKMYFPMLATTEEKGMKHLKYPLYVQPKLDGLRAIIFLKKKNGGHKNVVVYSRTKKEFPDMEYLKIMLYPYLNELFDGKQSIYLDGELYKHGKALQDINKSRRSKESRKKSDNTDMNEFHIYDCFYPLELDIPFEERKEQLDVLFDAMSDEIIPKYNLSVNDIVKQVPTWEVKSLKDAKKKFNDLTKKGYEGLMLRNKKGEYLADSEKTGAFMRSKDLVKMKQRFTDEFEVIDYTDGTKGKDKGAIIWVVKTKNDKVFNVTPKNITYEERYNIFQDCEKNFEKKYLGRMLTVEYEDLSKAGIPLRAKALIFRDYE